MTATPDDQERRRTALRRFLEVHRLSVNALAKKAGIPESTLRSFLGGVSATMTVATYDRLAKATDRPIGELLGEVDPTSARVPTRLIRVVGAVQAGAWREALELPPDEQFDIAAPIDEAYSGLPVIALRVQGASMNRVFPEGTYLVCVNLVHLGDRLYRRTGQPYRCRNGDYVIVQRRDRHGLLEATVKEYVVDDRGRSWLWPRSDDPEFQAPWPIPDGDPEDDGEDLRITALVVGLYRPLRPAG
jgi:transcriptional regulator with XRE-family HTH domain